MRRLGGQRAVQEAGTHRYGGGGIFTQEPADPTLKPLAQVLHARVLLHLTHDDFPLWHLRWARCLLRVLTKVSCPWRGKGGQLQRCSDLTRIDV